MARTRLPRRLVQLYVGLCLYGFAGALQVRSGLGLDPWDVFHQGIGNHVGLRIGTVVIIVGAAVLLLWIPLRQRPGLGTVSNVVLIGLSMNWSLDLLPPLGTARPAHRRDGRRHRAAARSPPACTSARPSAPARATA